MSKSESEGPVHRDAAENAQAAAGASRSASSSDADEVVRLRAERDQAIEMAARYKVLCDKLTRELAELQTAMSDLRNLGHRLCHASAAVDAERDLAEPLQ